MSGLAAPFLFVLFAWWFSTGAVIYLNNLPTRTVPWSVGVATLILPFCFAGIYYVRDITSANAAYCGFSCALVIWAWTQLTFYTGVLTGPRTTPCEVRFSGLRHFWHALETCLYHEMAAIAAGIAMTALTYGSANATAAWTYWVLWAMHGSAKVNAVLGIRNLNEEFFPPRLRYLRSFLRKRAINAFFPVSVTVGTVVTMLFFQRAFNAANPYEIANWCLLGTLMALAVLEHWLLILPIPAAALWAWGLKSRETGVGDGASEPAAPPRPPVPPDRGLLVQSN